MTQRTRAFLFVCVILEKNSVSNRTPPRVFFSIVPMQQRKNEFAPTPFTAFSVPSVAKKAFVAKPESDSQ